jgi:hypothetical protein
MEDGRSKAMPNTDQLRQLVKYAEEANLEVGRNVLEYIIQACDGLITANQMATKIEKATGCKIERTS